jgi:hypothetical protein
MDLDPDPGSQKHVDPVDPGRNTGFKVRVYNVPDNLYDRGKKMK